MKLFYAVELWDKLETTTDVMNVTTKLHNIACNIMAFEEKPDMIKFINQNPQKRFFVSNKKSLRQYKKGLSLKEFKKHIEYVNFCRLIPKN